MEVKHEGKVRGSTVSLGIFLVILTTAIILGVGTGYFARTFTPGAKTSSSDSKSAPIKMTRSEGVLDKKRFPDSAEGKLKKGGIDGEGSFHLERSGGESQNVYMTSSIVDLSKYIGKKVKVWGETQKAQKAGWLMDVGYIEVK
jgi:hypothetical protein